MRLKEIWEEWGGCLIYSLIIIIIIICFYYYDKKHSESLSNEDTVQLEEINKREEVFNSQMKNYCLKSSNEVTGIELYKCNNYLDLGYLVDNNFDEMLEEEPNIPEFCNRKIIEMKTNELLECLAEPEVGNEESN